MVKYLLKKSYQHKDLKEINFRDLWNDNGVFTTMWIYGKPPKILFFKPHIENLIKSLKIYKIYKKDTKNKILKLIKINIDKNKSYNHLFRLALNNNIISVSLRDRLRPKNNFILKLVNYERVRPEHKNLKYKTILKYLSRMNTTKKDIALCVNNKILETGTSNLLFVSKNKIYSPINKYYRGTNFKFYEKKFKIKKKDILMKELNHYDEIILVGSGKGVVSVKSVERINWKRKKIRIYKIILKTFLKEIKKQKYLYK
jgi:branched-subunit amino acid aminotransferase/4-amino-4-deoxychorismate lyase